MHKKKKILHIVGSMYDGGAQRVLYDYLEHKNELNKYELEFLSLNSKTNSTYDINIYNNGYKFIYLDIKRSNLPINILRRGLNFFKKVFAIIKYIKNGEYDAIHTHISTIFIQMLLPLLFYKGYKFHTMHSEPSRFVGVKGEIIKFAFHKLSVIPIAVSEFQRKKAIKHYGLKNCELLYNSVDFENIRNIAATTTKEIERDKFGIPLDAYVIGSVGRLHSIKQYDFLIRIFAKLYKKNNNAHLIIAGEGEERGNLEKLSDELNVKENVHLIGNLDQNEIYKFYKVLDVFTMVSKSESFSLTSLEAQAVGIRCIFANSIPPDIIINTNVRRMKNNASDEEWVDALLDNSYQGNSVNAMEHFSSDTMMLLLEALYDKYME